MPVTPYHFGPSGFVGLLFKRWIDFPVFVLANVVIDMEVATVWLLRLGYPTHRYCHTLIVGGAVGALWGLAAYPLRGLWSRIMSAYHLPYQPRIGRMVLSGILGAWAHVLVDGTQHADMKLFWPVSTYSLVRVSRPWVMNHRLEHICVLFFLLTLALYAFVSIRTPRE
jgi:membrane-bound metal-dependent hydrolase YbcI (DUF457 family)